MYFTDCKVIGSPDEIDVQKFKGYKAVGFISLMSSAWKTDEGKDRLRFLEQYLIHKDECFFYITTELSVREDFISIIRQCGGDVKIAPDHDFLIYYMTEDITYKETGLYIYELPSSIDDAMDKIDDAIDDLKKGIFVSKIKNELIGKTGILLFEVLKKVAGSYF